MKKEEITDVFFDLDHTLWDFERNSGLTYEKILKTNAIDVGLEQFLEVYVPNNLKLWELYREDKITKEALRFERLKTTFDMLKIAIPEAVILKLSDDYITHLPDFNHLFSDAVDILEYLHPKYNLHIITNGFAEVQQKKLQNSGIDYFFQVVMNSETAGVKKPNPLIFEKALKQARVKPENALMVGDSYEADILGAKKVGMKTILYTPNGGYLNVKTHIINELEEIKSYL
ncbi:YjjG family noncanonical pyrimidine nucleotidase [Galbibacter sp. EGI 63066]|nr:YjjG family noncanonical pyrimidine nucleotidase [Galbibacter sp. EGI 63066]